MLLMSSLSVVVLQPAARLQHIVLTAISRTLRLHVRIAGLVQGARREQGGKTAPWAGAWGNVIMICRKRFLASMRDGVAVSGFLDHAAGSREYPFLGFWRFRRGGDVWRRRVG